MMLTRTSTRPTLVGVLGSIAKALPSRSGSLVITMSWARLAPDAVALVLQGEGRPIDRQVTDGLLAEAPPFGEIRRLGLTESTS